jgi:hypothetical protein
MTVPAWVTGRRELPLPAPEPLTELRLPANASSSLAEERSAVDRTIGITCGTEAHPRPRPG